MSEPLKNIYSSEFLKDFGDKVHKVYTEFNSELFTACVLSPPWAELELKARIHKIAEKLGEYLPKDFEDEEKYSAEQIKEYRRLYRLAENEYVNKMNRFMRKKVYYSGEKGNNQKLITIDGD